jgi:hypothetical protein
MLLDQTLQSGERAADRRQRPTGTNPEVLSRGTAEPDSVRFVDNTEAIEVRSADRRSGILCAEAPILACGVGAPTFASLRMVHVDEIEQFAENQKAASLRSDGVLFQAGLVFGFPPECCSAWPESPLGPRPTSPGRQCRIRVPSKGSASSLAGGWMRSAVQPTARTFCQQASNSLATTLPKLPVAP